MAAGGSSLTDGPYQVTWAGLRMCMSHVHKRMPLFGPLAQCPGCGTPLDGGPVLYRCQACHRAVLAADVDIEYHAPALKAAA